VQQEELNRRATEHIRRRVENYLPPDSQIVHRDETDEWDQHLLRQISQHEYNLLTRGADLVMYFNNDGGLIGWRDDSRKGSVYPAVVDRDAFLDSVIAELDLKKDTRLGQLEPRKLPPLGWTHEGVLFEPGQPHKENVIRVWAEPETLKVIQWLHQSGTRQAVGSD
jgi:hypothetical protein